MPNFKDLTGKTFGRLKVISRAQKSSYGGTMWNCECSCGNSTVVDGGNMARGQTKSCGCIAVEKLIKMSTTHGKTNTGSFNSWKRMHDRCSYDRDKSFENYGGRGIKVCSRWSEFSNFYEDMGDRPQGHTLDRIDVNGDYCKENCRWATNRTQTNNKRFNHVINIDGEVKTISEWESHLGLNNRIIRNRLARGWSERDAVLTPAKKYNVHSESSEVKT